MQTRITRLLGIRHPLLCPGMTYVSNASLVAAVSNAGGLGILAVGHLSPEETRAEIRRVRELSDRPFGVGVALIMPGATQNAEVAIEEKVPVINFSLGKGDWICERVHAYGGKVIATVVNEKHAKGAERAGVDALLVTGHEAAAHGGDVTSLVLVPAIRQVTRLPIIATGGFVYGLASLAAWAVLSGRLPGGAVGVWAPWLAATVVFYAVLFVMIRRIKRERTSGGLPRVTGSAWAAIGGAMFTIILSAVVAAQVLNSAVVWAMVPSVFLSLYGAGWLIASCLTRRRGVEENAAA